MKTKGYCLICDVEIEVQMCCDGRECGCQGQPVDVPVCSEECYTIWENEKSTQPNPTNPPLVDPDT